MSSLDASDILQNVLVIILMLRPCGDTILRTFPGHSEPNKCAAFVVRVQKKEKPDLNAFEYFCKHINLFDLTVTFHFRAVLKDCKFEFKLCPSRVSARVQIYLCSVLSKSVSRTVCDVNMWI